ncbi:uncharacterized protein [Lolium perenne]|uniref:uncharacterized protein isoform X1 n=1 Tax=Lolium perenne TaxID=4522 RepID=UPI0021F61261|nr:uncharacterized protein LOC127298295 isoform X1 [Lolium perenne]
MEKVAARRRQVPAFGEWNYYHHYDDPEAAAVAPPALAYCYATPEPEACSDVWFRYSPPQRKPMPTKKPRRRVPDGDSDASLEKKGRRARPASEAVGGCGGGGLARATRVVRPVDEDLYQVPPLDLAASHKRRPRRRSLWMGCLGC